MRITCGGSIPTGIMYIIFKDHPSPSPALIMMSLDLIIDMNMFLTTVFQHQQCPHQQCFTATVTGQSQDWIQIGFGCRKETGNIKHINMLGSYVCQYYMKMKTAPFRN